VAQAVVRAAKGGDCKPRTAWLKRVAALCAWQLFEPKRGDRVDPEWHHAVDSGGDTVVRLACPGLKRIDGSGLVRARVQVDPAVASQPEEPDEPEAVPEPLAPPQSEPPRAAASDDDRDHGGDQDRDHDHEGDNDRDRDGDHEGDRDHQDEHRTVESPAEHDTPTDVTERIRLTAPAAAFTAPFGDLTGEGEIRPHEAAAAAASASRIPKIVSDDPARSDEALAAEVALAIETETSADPEWAQVARGPEAFDAQPAGPDEYPSEDLTEDDVEKVQDLSEPLPDSDPNAK
jgi:hypothetical protein